MYAIIRTGGKQYKVQAGDVVRVEKISKDLGDEFDVTEVLAIGSDSQTQVGEPMVENAKVTVVVTNQSRAPKVVVFKKKRRQGYRRMQGHRQSFTELFIKAIVDPSGKVDQAKEAARVFDPAKAKERKEQAKAAPKAAGEKKAAKAPAKKKAAKKKTAKKAAKKKTAKKSGKKKAAKKKTAAKKTAKKKTKKKTKK